MSDNMNNSNNKVFQIPNMTERQSSTNTTFINNNNNQNIDTTQAHQAHQLNLPSNNTQIQAQQPQHQHFINVPTQIPQINTNTNILEQLGLPPIQPQPPAAFQPVQPVAIPQIASVPVMPNMNTLNMVHPQSLNASAPVFTPNPCANIPLPVIPQNDSNNNTASAGNILAQNQMTAIKQKINESLAKLQILSLQLNTLNLINQQNQTLQSLQQYQNVYQQYQLELTNTYLLNQYLQNLTNIVSTPTPQGPAIQTPITPAQPQLLNGKSAALETIEEGEEEEMEDNDDNIAAIAGSAVSISPMTDNEGTDNMIAAAYANANQSPVCMDEQKNDTEPSTDSAQIGEHEQCPMNIILNSQNGNFQKFMTGRDTETDTMKQGETLKKKEMFRRITKN